MEERLLIISNTVLSQSRSMGKTLLSYFGNLPGENVSQLYFSGETPEIEGYNYYRLSDTDIIKGILNKSKRGRRITETAPHNDKISQQPAKMRTSFFRLVREALWFGKWKSPQLLEWLETVSPTRVFFLGGDCVFAYTIARFVAKRYNAGLSLYITDDYVCPRQGEGMADKIRRRLIKKAITKTLEATENFFTICAPMQQKYKEIFGKDSNLTVNMPDSLYMPESELKRESRDYIELLYAGSLYYGRDKMLGKIAGVLEQYNINAPKKAVLTIYSNDSQNEYITLPGVIDYGGHISFEELKEKLNLCDIPVFVESFECADKTRYSLSTKVPEYLSVKKPIFAVGPSDIGSISYLSDCAMCAFLEEDIQNALNRLLSDKEMQESLSQKAWDKFSSNHNKDKNREILQNLIFKGEIQ